MTQILNACDQTLIFEVRSARIAEPESGKYVLYTLEVRYTPANDNSGPSVIERRYTQFQNLYNSLKKDFPALMGDISFPKKVITGNFHNELISERSTAFENLLKHISHQTKLRTSRAMQIFLQEPELSIVKRQFEDQSPLVAIESLENIFRLLNKVFLDRSHAVLLTLCRLVAYCSQATLAPNTPTMKWADLALYRFSGVSDSDILELYVPLLYASITIYKENKRDYEGLNIQLENLRKQGVNVTQGNKKLLNVLDEVEARIF